MLPKVTYKLCQYNVLNVFQYKIRVFLGLNLKNQIWHSNMTFRTLWPYKPSTLNSTYNEVIFNKKSAIMKENVCTKYTTYTYKYVALNEKLPITKQNLHIFFLL